jgi:hypothetical protein
MRRLHLSILLVLGLPSSVFAHAVNLECTLRGSTVYLEAFYDDDTPAIKAKVQVLNAKEEVVASGLTDEKGQWTFATPPAGKYEVRLDAGAGHRAKSSIQVPSAPVQETISDGPTRSEFTRIPWLSVLLGLAIIGGGCGAFWLVSFIKRHGTSPQR